MKNMVSTIIVFGFIFIIILGGAFLFQKMNGLDTIKNADHRINEDIHKIIDAVPVLPADNTSEAVSDSLSGAESSAEESLAPEVPAAENSDNGSSLSEESLREETHKEFPQEVPSVEEPENEPAGDVSPSDASPAGGMTISYPLYETASNDAGKAFDDFVKEDPIGKSIKNIGRQLKEDSKKIKKDFSGRPDNGQDNKSNEEKQAP